MQRVLVSLIVLLTVACGSSATSPTGTAASLPEGLWLGTVTQTTASGGPECLLTFQSSNGVPVTYTLQINRTGSDLTATTVSAATNQTCDYTGTWSSPSISLTATACAPEAFQLTCNGVARDVYRVSRTYAGTQNSNVLTGSTADTWNVFDAGDKVTMLNTVKTTSTFILRR